MSAAPAGATVTTCSTCGHAVKVRGGIAEPCANCAHYAAKEADGECPPADVWDKGFKSWLWIRYMTQVIAGDKTIGTAWLRILASCFSYEWVGVGRERRRMRHGEPIGTVYRLAREEYDRAMQAAETKANAQRAANGAGTTL